MTRKHSIDFLRFFCALAVIFIHVITAPIKNTFSTIDSSVESTLNIIHNLLLWCVPIFFMITGYCIGLKKECTYKYCFSQILKFISVLFTFRIIFFFFRRIFYNKKN